MPANARALVLAFVSGFVDTAVFVAMGGLFVAHVTGNFVLLGATLAGATSGGAHEGAATLQLIAFPVFFISAMLAPAIAARVPPQRGTLVLLALATLLLVLGALAAVLGLQPKAVIALGFASAMGLLNAAHRMDAKLGPPFTVMTGNVTAVAIEAAHRLGLAPTTREGPVGAPAATMLALVIAFALGCAVGALVERALGLGAMLLPSALLALALLAPIERRREG